MILPNPTGGNDSPMVRQVAQAAVDAGEPLFGPPLVYRLDDKVVVNVDVDKMFRFYGAGVSFDYLSGAGCGTRFVCRGPAWEPAFQVRAPRYTPGQSPTNVFFELEGFGLIRDGDPTDTIGMRFGDWNSFMSGLTANSVRGVRAFGFHQGFSFLNARQVRLENCNAMTPYVGAHSCFVVEAQSGLFAGDLFFETCQFISNGDHWGSRVGVVAANSAAYIAALHFEKCIFYYGENSLQLFAGVDSMITDVFMQGCQFDGLAFSDPDTKAAIDVQANGHRAVVSGVNIVGCYAKQWKRQAIGCAALNGGRLTDVSIVGGELGNCEEGGVSFYCQPGSRLEGAKVQGVSFMDIGRDSTPYGCVGFAGDSRGFSVTGNTHTVGRENTCKAGHLVRIEGDGHADKYAITGNVGEWTVSPVMDAGKGTNKLVQGNF